MIYKLNKDKTDILKAFQKTNGYVLQDGEFEFANDLINYNISGGILIDTTTQQEREDNVESEIENTLIQNLNKYRSDGEEFFKKLGNFIRRKRENGKLVENATPEELALIGDSIKQNTITQAQYKGIRVTLQPALQPLRYGDWDIAQDNINAITPPTNAKMLLIYNFVKNKVDTYVAVNNF